jgi:hypothetical protein
MMGIQETILDFKGDLTFSTIGRLLTLLKHKMVEKDIKIGIYKRILSVMIEALENIYKYSDQYYNNPDILKKFTPSFTLNRIDQKYVIKTTNPIKKIDIPVLREKIDLVNNKSPEDLRLLYRQTIMNGKFTEKGGAGLGLIEMAKITNNSIGYSFESISNDFSLYSLILTFS